jgi:Rps23 Pro-64 3,4-dihydroxylase Tpa1-like proline 4-hydroxylase
MEILVQQILDRLNYPIDSYEFGQFKFWIIDDLLPVEFATEIAKKFPEEHVLRQRETIREYKKVGVDFDLYEEIMEDITYSFHDKRVVDRIGQITGIDSMIPDAQLYAGGLSSMTKNSFLNPHLDNSHDDDKKLYRVLNLLYYVSKDWKIEYGGNLLLFPNGLRKQSIEIESKFNRLVLMETNNFSYHAVTKVLHDHPRRCVSNYYFRVNSTNGMVYNHVTSFYAFPSESRFKSSLFALDRSIRQLLSSRYKKIINYKNWHKRGN